jgi:hypothetical protein
MLRVAARGIVALAVTLLLTITVPYLPGRDGWQAAHFFFMPPVAWATGTPAPPTRPPDAPAGIPAGLTLGAAESDGDTLAGVLALALSATVGAGLRPRRMALLAAVHGYALVYLTPPVPPPRAAVPR